MHAKGSSTSNGFIVVVFTILASAAFTACGVDYKFGSDVPAYPCLDTTYEDYHSIGCREARCAGDAGIPEDNCNDAGIEGAGSSARCSGTCVRNKPDGFDPPQPVYIGPPLAKYVFGCPEFVGANGALGRYTGFHVPTSGCPSCVCGTAEGACSITPNSLVVRTDICNQPASTADFGGPPGWDGSCTNVNAVPMGAECPPGSGVLCAQSIDSSAMLEPIESCEPISLPVPKFTSDWPWWEATVLSCSSTVLDGACDAPAAETCLPSVPADVEGWRYCVSNHGIHDCPNPGESDYSERFVAYPKDAYTDTRACTACSCSPKGSSCSGTLRVYSDDSCSTNEIVVDAVGTGMTNCSNLAMSGVNLGSKEITDVIYSPGSCEPSGGEPIGDVVLQDDKAVTWCCAKPKPVVPAPKM